MPQTPTEDEKQMNIRKVSTKTRRRFNVLKETIGKTQAETLEFLLDYYEKE